MDQWWGRLGYDREGIVREHEYKTKAEADAYVQGCLDAMEQAECGTEAGDENPLEDYWAVASARPSMSEEDAAKLSRSSKHHVGGEGNG